MEYQSITSLPHKLSPNMPKSGKVQYCIYTGTYYWYTLYPLHLDNAYTGQDTNFIGIIILATGTCIRLSNITYCKHTKNCVFY